MKKLVVLLLALALVCSSTFAFAETVRFEGALPQLTLTDENGENPWTVEAEEIVLLLRLANGRIQVYTDGVIGYIEPVQLAAVYSDLNADSLPLGDELATIDANSDRDTIRRLQQTLADSGYLQGAADGLFGNMTRNALISFQTDHGLAPTGTADATTQQLLFTLAEAPHTVLLYSDPSEQFNAIKDRTEANLEPLIGAGLSFEYDDITGSGFISNGNQVVFGTESSGIDGCMITVRFGFEVSESGGKVNVKPIARIHASAVRRPMLQKMYYKSGVTRINGKTSGTTNGVAGSKSVEDCKIALNDAAKALLASVADNGELKLRIEGKYASYDAEVSEDELALLAQIGQLAIAMTAQPEDEQEAEQPADNAASQQPDDQQPADQTTENGADQTTDDNAETSADTTSEGQPEANAAG